MANNSIVVESFNSIITDTIVNVLSFCRLDAEFNQNMMVRCENNHIREANESCLRLLNNFNLEQYDLQLREDSSNYQRIIQDFQMNLSNITLNSCKGCYFDNIQQNMLFALDGNCEFDTVSDNIIEAAASQTVDNTLDNHGDLLSGLAGAMGFTTTNQIKQELSTRISTLISTDILTESLTQVRAYQNMTIDNVGIANFIHQNTVIDVVNTIVVNTQISNEVLSQSEWQIINELINDQGTIADIGEMYLTGLNVLNALAETIMGRVILAVCVLAGIVMLLFLTLNSVAYGPDIWNSILARPTNTIMNSLTNTISPFMTDINDQTTEQTTEQTN